jgi:hypothetical protein
MSGQFSICASSGCCVSSVEMIIDEDLRRAEMQVSAFRDLILNLMFWFLSSILSPLWGVVMESDSSLR